MFHLIYTSRSHDDFAAADLKQLLRRSRASNGRVNVTGVLVYHASAFLQALEGDESCVRDICKRIEKDPRHTGVSILRDHNSFGERRIFWRLVDGVRERNQQCASIEGLVDLASNPDLLTLTEKQAMELFSRFSQSLQIENASKRRLASESHVVD